MRRLALEDAYITWCLRFSQSGRMSIRPQRVRPSTWIAAANGELIEIHLIGAASGVATL